MKPDDKFAWLGYLVIALALSYFALHIAAYIAANI